jgi:hypothetical protein
LAADEINPHLQMQGIGMLVEGIFGAVVGTTASV